MRNLTITSIIKYNYKNVEDFISGFLKNLPGLWCNNYTSTHSAHLNEAASLRLENFIISTKRSVPVVIAPSLKMLVEEIFS